MVQISVVIIMTAMWLWMRSCRRSRHRTLRWLRDNQWQINDSEQFFPDSPFPTRAVGKQSPVRSFRIVTSFLLVTVVVPVGGDLKPSPLRLVIATLWTLLLGWWALPWGPIRTVAALWTNLRGGDRATVGEVALLAESYLHEEGAVDEGEG